MTGGPAASGGYAGSSHAGSVPRRSYEERAAAKEQMMQSLRDSSQQERRVYVGNLSYDVKWHHLKDFMRQAGEVLFADVLLLPNGMSKGCGIVEFASRDQAQHAVSTLSNQDLMGRLVYVREDRESEPRFTSPSGARGGYDSGSGPPAPPPRGGGYGSFGGPGGGNGGGGGGGNGPRQLYVSNLPYMVGWQDLKDLFRQAAQQGVVVRADVHNGPDGRSKGSGIVAFDNPEDARNAITQFNGYEWQGRPLEVREDRFAGFGPGFGGSPRAGYGGRGAFGARGSYGGRGGGGGYGRAGYGGYGGGGGGGSGNYGSTGPVSPNSFTDNAASGGEPSETIHVRNLPWSTSNEDLVELFTTIGKVERAEIQYEPNGRSKGTGVVQFDTTENADTAINKFSGYQYGGRPLGLTYVKYLNDGGDAMEGTEGPANLTQDQIM